MICIIGSGPTGIAAAQALVRSGQPILMLDAGRELEPETEVVRARMAATEKTRWQAPDRQQICQGMKATPRGVGLKLAYGSDYPYRDASEQLGLALNRAGVRPSFAKGGFSSVWGGAILPNRAEDMADWPISLEELSPHYRALHEFMPLSGRRDQLEQTFPLFADPLSLPLSHQAEALVRALENRPVAGLRQGQARLALDAGCAACGLCLYGCPYGLIYNSMASVRNLQAEPNFTYQPGTIVERIEESADQVIIHGRNRDGQVRLKADALFLAAGVLPTSRIILASLEAWDHSLQLANSQYFLFPLLRSCRTGGVRSEELHTLCQLFLELDAPELSPNLIHLQCYTYNDLYARAAAAALGPAAKMLPLNMLMERLLLFQGYLHSDHSPKMHLVLDRRGNLLVTGEATDKVGRIVRGVMKKLRPLGIPFAPKIGLPGDGFHCGGSFPMRHSPDLFESDSLGRPHGFSKVHIVDASVMPSIPATTITYTAMANAHRIASAYADPPAKSTRTLCCAVTGANGYVGKVIVNYLRKQGLRVIPLVRDPHGPERAYSLESPVAPETLRGVDFLVHAAYDFTVTTAAKLREVNIEGSRRLFSAACSESIRTVYISSLSAFDGCHSDYGRTKREIEKLARDFGCFTVRPGLVFGPQTGRMLKSLKLLADRTVVPLIGKGDQKLYLTHQDDLAQLVHHLLTKTGCDPTEPIAAAHNEPVTMRQILGRLAGASRFYLPIPAFLVMIGLGLLETCGFSSRLRRDSLISLLNPNNEIDLSHLEKTGIPFRGFLD